MPNIITKVRQQPAWIAVGIFLCLVLWMMSGLLEAETKSTTKQGEQKIALAKVKVETLYAEQVNREVALYGRTEPDRVAKLRAEVQGLVSKIHVNEGQAVSTGQLLVELEQNDLVQQLQSANAVLAQRNLELKGANSLKRQGYQSQVTLAQAKANVEMAKTQVSGLNLAIEKTRIYAPFSGRLNERHVELGDLLREGDNIATVVDLDPLIIEANVTESHIQHIQVGQVAHGQVLAETSLTGEIRYISSVSNSGTNTFRIEVAVPNPDMHLVAGMSTQLSIPLQQTWATKVTPAVMSLDESGNLGVKTVVNNQVNFVPIDIVKSEGTGVWLAGLGEQADVITLGHGFVRHGDEVEAAHQQQGE